MKKSVCLIILLVCVLTGCNKQVIDLNYEYDRAILYLPNGEVVEGAIESWRDYEGEQLQVKIDGVLYLTNSYNCVLIREGEE